MVGVGCTAFALDRKLQDAAKHTVDYFVKNGMLLGLGTGPASLAAISHIGHKLHTGALREIVGVPMSTFGASEAAKAGLPLKVFGDNMKLDFAFDDADSIQEGTLFAVIGRKGMEGRESIIKEKAIAKAANQFVFVVEETKFTQQLTGAIPVMIRQENWLEIAEEIDDLFLGEAEVWRRPSFGEAGPLGGDFPLVTTEGHFVLDVIFTTPIASPADVAGSLEAIDGVVEHGLVLDTAYAAAIGGRDGVKIRTSLFRSSFTSMD